MRCRRLNRRSNLLPQRNENGLRHPLVEWDDRMTLLAIGARVMKDANYCRVATLEHADNAAHAAPVGFGRLYFHQHLVALHGAVDFVGRNENVITPCCLTRVRSHKTVTVAMQIETAGGQIVARAERP